MCGASTRSDHVLTRERADLGHGLDAIPGPGLRHRTVRFNATRRVHRRTSSRARGDELFDVTLRHATRDTRSLHLRDLDAMLGGDLSHQRRGFAAKALLESSAVAARWNG